MGSRVVSQSMPSPHPREVQVPMASPHNYSSSQAFIFSVVCTHCLCCLRRRRFPFGSLSLCFLVSRFAWSWSLSLISLLNQPINQSIITLRIAFPLSLSKKALVASPYFTMFSRQTTPPTTSFNYLPGSVGSISDGGFYSHDASPAESHYTANTSPPRSPIRQTGPLLLPKVRTQDQIAEPTGGPVRHRRTTSTASSMSYGSAYSPYSRPNSMVRRGSSPFANHNVSSTLASPASTSSYDLGITSTLNSPIVFASEPRRASIAVHGRSHSASGLSRHSRAGSAGSIDESVISRYGFPTYRNLPTYVTSSSAAQPNLNLVTALPSTIPQLQEITYAPSNAPAPQDFNYSDFEQAPAVQYPFSTDVSFDSFPVMPTSSLLSYLTSPNPSPALVRRLTAQPRGINTHFWWDVRNLRSWSDFTIPKLTSIPSVLPLLEVPITSDCLPEPPRQNPQPDNESALHDIYTAHYTTKINAALKVAQGTTHMVMRGVKSVPGGRPQPDFISSYPSDYEKTIHGDPRGRVVGLVKCYDAWNTGMRSESPPKQVLYLQGLAHLQRVMREHGCRYGFIMTEIELLCVRCGGPSDASTLDPSTVNATAGVPIFGYLEVSAPIRLSTSSSSSSSSSEEGEPEIQMTAPLALWYLHMLAKENPFDGMGSWRMDVGGPAALTRQNVLEKDAWIPKPQMGEKREAKRVRGWVLPEDPLSKRECGRGRRKGSLA
ncbi:hypothetical protein DM02DRAFT_276357 [Periconia macrospinosa]|uniref:Sialidase n=1 Tax=Periconia macrospinosa TaxID=97972 RepID=A0A2V1D334_9PLEO|nr:hypothetical protein DM02DRAFT_276357 [Periconia macrospinosa]